MPQPSGACPRVAIGGSRFSARRLRSGTLPKLPREIRPGVFVPLPRLCLCVRSCGTFFALRVIERLRWITRLGARQGLLRSSSVPSVLEARNTRGWKRRDGAVWKPAGASPGILLLLHVPWFSTSSRYSAAFAFGGFGHARKSPAVVSAGASWGRCEPVAPGNPPVDFPCSRIPPRGIPGTFVWTGLSRNAGFLAIFRAP